MYADMGCDDRNDMVDDTAPQANFTMPGTCPVGRKSCPNQAGFDNVHNYMDYSGDGCQNEFTPGQVARMHSMFHEIRESAGVE